MTISFIILLICFIIAILLFLYFKKENSKKIETHQIIVNRYLKRVEFYSLQIKKRENTLNTYDFISYNLKEALLVQNIE